jgi:GT2 family glycosyltransferase
LQAVTEPVAPPDLAAVVVNYNGGRKVVRAIEALREHAPEITQIILVDNGSTDDSIATIRARYPTVDILELGANLGLPAGRNVGLARATTDQVLMVDTDVFVTPGCVAEMLAVAERFGAAAVCPRIVLLPGGDTVQCDGAMPHYVGTLGLINAGAPREGAAPAAAPVGGLIGAIMLLDRRTVIDAGGFNELYFLYSEDLDFSLRLRLQGYEIVCAPQAVAEHDRGTGTVGLAFRGAGAYPPRRAFYTFRDRWLTIALYYSRRSLLLFAPALLAYELLALAFAVRRGLLRQWFAAHAWLIRHRDEIRRQRRTLQARRIRPDSDLLSGTALSIAPGLVRSRIARRMASGVGGLLASYWRLTVRWT